jgi:hypothetical protein
MSSRARRKVTKATKDYITRFSTALLSKGLVFGPSTTDKDWSVTATDGCVGNFMFDDLEANAKKFAPEEAAEKFAEFFAEVREKCGF